jgi:hypothetical protein
MTHDLLEKAAISAIDLDKSVVHYDDVDSTRDSTMKDF